MRAATCSAAAASRLLHTRRHREHLRKKHADRGQADLVALADAAGPHLAVEVPYERLRSSQDHQPVRSGVKPVQDVQAACDVSSSQYKRSQLQEVPSSRLISVGWTRVHVIRASDSSSDSLRARR